MGYLTVLFILIHALIALFNYRIINLTGLSLFIFMIIQVVIGIIAVKKKHFKQGKYLYIHRILTIILIIFVLTHIYFSWSFNSFFQNIFYKEEITTSQNIEEQNSNLIMLTIDELSKFDGKNGNKAYVAINGDIYDVSDIPEWKNGDHYGNYAGQDLTEALKYSPHGSEIIDKLNLKPIGKIKNTR